MDGFFFKEGEDNKAFKKEIVEAWGHIHRRGKESLGKPNCVSLEPYLQWVQARAISLKMPYPRQEPLSSGVKKPILIFMDDAEKLQIALTEMRKERDAW